MFVCVCAQLTEEDILQAIKLGLNDLPKLQRGIGACCNCKLCLTHTQDILKHCQNKEINK